MADKEEYAKKFEDISIEKNRGILKLVKKASDKKERPYVKDTCLVRYVGTYWGGDDDGKEFDRSDDFSFQLGTNNVIKAWDTCVATMCIGEVCELIASPENCYNDGKSMKFEIELFSSHGEDVSDKKNKSILKSIIEEGDGIIKPAFGVEAKISYKLFGDDAAKPVEETYLTGDPSACSFPPIMDQAIRNMSKYELAKIVTGEGHGDSPKSYEVKLLSFEKLKHLSSFENFSEQMKYAETLKDRANGHLKATKYKIALETYKRLYSDLEYLVTNGSDEKNTLDNMKIAVLNNSALAELKLNNYEEVITQSNKALEIQPKSEKALFRLGQTYLQMKDHETALHYFSRCAHFHPNNVDALKLVQSCNQQIQKAKNMEKARFRGIYNKLKETGLGLPNEPEPVESEKEEESESDLESEPVKETA
ncbi:FK506-binding protein 5 [Cichlidogyrus casuarinus]|uniref:peptidylprolyl isomerase n=1 Tax=Cichlidogyrus casuarinus TaxID=1844966 RepID=A0ABD2QGD0_9PLAT